MPYFYNFIILSGVSLIISFLLTAALFLILDRSRTAIFPITIPSFVGTNFIVFIIALLLCNPLLYQLQIATATPYVEEALSQQCHSDDFRISEGIFTNNSKFGWESINGDTTCYDNGQEWRCRC